MIGEQLGGSWLDLFLDSPGRGGGRFVGVWTDDSTLVLSVINASASDAYGWGANASVSLRQERMLLNAAQTSLAANGSATLVTGGWGSKRGPTVTRLVAAGSPVDAVYSRGDSITLYFSVPTNLAGGTVGPSLSPSAIDELLYCGFEVEPTPVLGVSMGANLTATWLDTSTLRLTVHDVDGAAARLTEFALTEIAGAGIGSLRCCIRAKSNLRDLPGTSLPSSSCSPPLGGLWGSKQGPLLAKVSLSDAYTAISTILTTQYLLLTTYYLLGVFIRWSVAAGRLIPA